MVVRVSNLLPKATYIFAFKHSFVFGDENGVELLKKRNSKESVKKTQRNWRIALQNVLLLHKRKI